MPLVLRCIKKIEHRSADVGVGRYSHIYFITARPSFQRRACCYTCLLEQTLVREHSLCKISMCAVVRGEPLIRLLFESRRVARLIMGQ
jgi:hypothetical protein